MNHLELGKHESDQACSTTPWLEWCASVEKALGHDLDGTQWIDGYSIDYARDYFESNFTVGEMVRIVQDNREAIARGQFITELSCKSRKAYNDDGEETAWDDITLYVGENATTETIEAYIDEYYPSEHCQHEYDCCGHWYASRARYKRHGALVQVKRPYYLNV